MKKLYLLAICLLSLLVSGQQKVGWILGYQNPGLAIEYNNQFTFWEADNVSGIKQFSYHTELIYSHECKTANSGLEIALSVSKSYQQIELQNPNYDPLYGPLFGDYERGSSTVNLLYIVPELGYTYRVALGPGGRNNIKLPIGISSFIPLSGSHVQEIYPDNRKYVDITINRGIEDYWYGIYFRPNVEISLSRKISNPWRFMLFLESQLLTSVNKSLSSIVLFGGGLGLTYRISHPF